MHIINSWRLASLVCLNYGVAVNFLGRTKYYIFSGSSLISDIIFILVYALAAIKIFSYMGILAHEIWLSVATFNLYWISVNIVRGFSYPSMYSVVFSDETVYGVGALIILIGFVILISKNTINKKYIPTWPSMWQYVIAGIMFLLSRTIFLLYPDLVSNTKFVD